MYPQSNLQLILCECLNSGVISLLPAKLQHCSRLKNGLKPVSLEEISVQLRPSNKAILAFSSISGATRQRISYMILLQYVFIL